MAFIPGYEFIIKNKLGIIYNFYLNEQNHVEYIISNNKGQWINKNVVIMESTENFYVEIDDKDHIHIISFHSDGALYYSYFDNDHWQNHLIIQYPVNEQKILYPTIKYINNQLHIFYYLLNAKEKNKAYLLHINFKNKNYHTSHITTVFSHSYFNPFKIFYKDDNEIILLYGSVVNGADQVLISKLNIHSGKWMDSICLTHSKDKKLYINGLMDQNKTLHIIWSNYDEKYLVVQYLSLDTNSLDVNANDLNPIPLSSESSASFPSPIYYKDLLCVIWAETNKVASCYSTDMGKTWSKPFVDHTTRNLDFKRYQYMSNNLDKNNILCDFVFGSLYPNIQFLGFGGETNDDIPTS